MGFSEIPPIEKYDFYLDIAFGTARNAINAKRSSIRGDKIRKARKLEYDRLFIINKTIKSRLVDIAKTFPNFDDLSEFYEQLVRTMLDFDKIKASLGALNWASNKISTFTREYQKRLSSVDTPANMKSVASQYSGRVSSVMRQIAKNLRYLEETRKTVKDFPSIKEDYFTVAIAGFPNVGKSTVLSKLTDSKPDIQPYAFTTKTLNVGYMKHGVRKVQFIDTPGTLNRIDKMNKIEKIAYLAMKYCADQLVYVYDLTESYSLEEQEKLHKKVLAFRKPTLVYLSKTDILPKEVVDSFKKPAIKDIEKLKQEIISCSS